MLFLNRRRGQEMTAFRVASAPVPAVVGAATTGRGDHGQRPLRDRQIAAHSLEPVDDGRIEIATQFFSRQAGGQGRHGLRQINHRAAPDGDHHHPITFRRQRRQCGNDILHGRLPPRDRHAATHNSRPAQALRDNFLRPTGRKAVASAHDPRRPTIERRHLSHLTDPPRPKPHQRRNGKVIISRIDHRSLHRFLPFYESAHHRR